MKFEETWRATKNKNKNIKVNDIFCESEISLLNQQFAAMPKATELHFWKWRATEGFMKLNFEFVFALQIELT